MMISRAPKIWALAALAGFLAACGGSDNPVCSPTDPGCDPGNGNGTTPTPLVVSQVSPTNGSSSVATDSEVTVTFSRPVAAASVTPTSVTVGSVAGTRATSGTSVTFTPDTPFAEGTSYTVTVNGVTDADGVGLDGSFSSSFTTLSSPLAANAGPDMDVSAGSQAMLDGSASTGTGATFTWTQLAGPTVGTLTGQTPTFEAPAEISKLTFELSVSGGSGSEADTVHVWVLEDADQALWVSSSGSDSNPGTREAPMATLQAAIDAADGAGNGADVYVAGGEYVESVTLRSRVSLYGGWDETDWSRDIDTRRAVVRGGSMAVRGTESNNLVLEGLEVVAEDATTAGTSSVAIWLINSTGVEIRRNIIRAGAGAMGVAGATPNRTRTGSTGSRGGDAQLCVSRTSGGSGGANYRAGGTGGLGGGTNPTGGSSGSSSGGGGGGAGTSGSKNGGRGVDATTGGPVGTNGAAGSAFGTVNESGEYVATAAGGNTGTNGGAGYGGGGGGGAYGLVGFCGGSGGGGGGGGERGLPGTGGMGGGASFALLAVGPGSVSVADNEMYTAGGGVGGRGANGGAGGLGGQGNNGGTRGCDAWFPSICTGTGGRGGNGSAGGRGGHGGGGGGGPSIAIVEGATTALTQTGNTFVLGEGGGGGTSSGNSGPAGEAADHKKLTP